MNQNDSYLYVGTHKVPIYKKNGFMEQRSLNITISDNGERIQIKLKDPTEYCFNFTENITLYDFEAIRINQSLDINYLEFKTNIVDMLNQFQSGEMNLKCEINEKKNTLTFFTKSKIKNIIYLTLELCITNQSEIISEMYLEINEVQELNKRFEKQVVKLKKQIQEKEMEVQNMEVTKNRIMTDFRKAFLNIEELFSAKLYQIQGQLLSKFSIFISQISDLQEKVEKIQKQHELGIHTNNNIKEKLKNLQQNVESRDANIQQLKKENTSLNILRINLERNIADLTRHIEESRDINVKLEERNSVLEEDLKKLSIIVTQRENKISELSKDLVQANNMLVGFNQHYDTKSQQVEDLENAVLNKEKLLKEQQSYTNRILKSFEEYKNTFNNEKFEELKKNLTLHTNRNEELQEEIRKLNKMNALLSQKVNQDYLFGPK